MTPYEKTVAEELKRWKKRMQAKPSFINRLSKRMQTKINSVIPEKIHVAITAAIKQMTRAVCVGAEFTTKEPLENVSLQERELKVFERIKFYSRTAAAEGAV